MTGHLRHVVVVLALTIGLGGALFLPRHADAATPPLWVNCTCYGGAAGGFYWDPVSYTVWASNAPQWRGFPQANRPSGPLWVDMLAYGSAGGGFYLDVVSNQVWTAERGWHRFAPAVVPGAPTPSPTTLPPRFRIGATCRDGTRSNATGSGACSHHGGVSFWIYNR